MSFSAFLLIVGSAALHATWNLLAKKNRATLPYYAIICTTSALMWLHTQFWTPVALRTLPFSFWAWMFLCISSDVLYCAGLILSYRRMEMATAYPAMRALPIVFTAVLTSLTGWGAPLSAAAKTGFAIVFCGSMMMPLVRFSDFSLKNYFNRNIVFILMTACGTTGYTILDSHCMKILAAHAGDVSPVICSMTYYSLRGLMLCSVLWSIVLLNRKRRKELRDLRQNRNWTPLLAGFIASMTYILVLTAMNFVDNVSYVQVFRQLGLPIGMAFGVLILKEKCTAPKLAGIILILTGLTVSVLK